MSKVLVVLVIGFLLLGLAVSSVAAYQGYGIQQVGQHHLRSGSVYGPNVQGGGPGVGK